MNVEQLMTREVDTCRPGDTLDRAAQIMWEKDCGCVPVVSDDGSSRVIGVVTDRDLCLAAFTQARRLDELTIETCMSSDVRCCRPEDPLDRAEALMREARVRRLPVVDEGERLVGVISLADLAREAAREEGRPQPEITEAEVAETLASITQPRQRPEQPPAR